MVDAASMTHLCFSWVAEGGILNHTTEDNRVMPNPSSGLLDQVGRLDERDVLFH